MWGLKQQGEGGQVASWFACGAGRQINQAHASVLIRDLRFTAVVTERFLLANGFVCLETLLIASLPFPSRRICGCKAMSGEEQEKSVLLKGHGIWSKALIRQAADAVPLSTDALD